jgi:hypothetical protein
MAPTIKELVKDNIVIFDSYRAGIFYYNVMTNERDVPVISVGSEEVEEWNTEYDIYQFPVPVEDIGNATLLSEDKAITYMRWIRKAMNDGTLIKLKQ